MGTKHTPGPWAWQKFGAEYYLTAQHGMREIILCAKKGLPHSLVMNQDGILRPLDPNHPNAKLITAAPDLLKELSIMIECWDKDTFADIDIECARAAIKKATE